MTAFAAENRRDRLAKASNSTRPVREAVKDLTVEGFLNICLRSRADDLWHHGRD